MDTAFLEAYVETAPSDFVWQFDNGIVVGADGKVARVDLAVGYPTLEDVPRLKMRNGMNEFARIVLRREAVERLLALLERDRAALEIGPS